MTHTPINFDALEAGRGLDALVAEKLLGWTWEGDVLRAPGLTQPASFYPQWDLPDGRSHLGGLMEYSSDIAGAWAVVEAMRGKGYRFCVSDHDGEWIADFERLDTGEINGTRAATPPLAICAGALATLERFETPIPRVG